MTDLRLYSPFTDAPFQSPPRFDIKELEGHCSMPSSTNPQSLAFRCHSAKQTFDSCFAPKYGAPNRVACMNSPWDHHGTIIKLTAPLPNGRSQHLDMSRARPWAIELADNVHCIRVAQGKNDHYQCSDKSTLNGPLYRCKPTWTMPHTRKNIEQIENSDIIRAWF